MAKAGVLQIKMVGDTAPLQKSLKGLPGKVGGALKTVAKVGTAAFAATGAAAVGGAFKVAEFGDEVAKSSQKAGLGVEQFQELRFAFGQGGVEASTFDTAMQKFNKRLGESATTGGTADEAFESLGVSLRDADGNVRDASGAMDEVLPKLADIESDAERAALAGDLFGQRAGPELAAALADGGGGIDEAREKAQELGIVMGEDAAESAEKFTDSWDDLKQSSMGLLRSGLTPLMEILSDRVFPFVQNKIVPAFQEFGAFVGKVTDAFRGGGLSDALGMVGDKIAEVAPVVGEKLREMGRRFVEWVRPQIPPMLERLGELLASIGGWIVDTGLPWLGENLVKWGRAFVEWIGPMIPPALRKLGELLAKLGEWLIDTALPTVVEKLGEWGKAFLEWVGPAIPPMLKELGKLLVDLGKWLVTKALPKIVEKLVEWSMAFAGWVLTDALPWLIENAWKLSKRLGKWIVEDALPGIVEKLIEWSKAFRDWVLDDAWPWLKMEAAKLAVRMVEWIGEKVTDLKEKLLEWAGAFADWVMDDAWPDLKEKANELRDAMIEWIGEKVSEWQEKLGEWVVAFVDWVKEARTKLMEKLGGMATDVVDWAKKLPGKILDALGNLGSKLADKFKFSLPGISFSGSGDGPGAPVPDVGGSTRNRVQAAMENIPGLRITSTYRSPAQNAAVGGSPTSYHMDRSNPAVDIGGTEAALDQLHAVLQRMGGWRELIWRAPGHYDHVHVAHEGGRVTRDGIAPLRSDELLTKLQVGETVLPRRRGGGDGNGVGRSVTVNVGEQHFHDETDLEAWERRVASMARMA